MPFHLFDSNRTLRYVGEAYPVFNQQLPCRDIDGVSYLPHGVGKEFDQFGNVVFHGKFFDGQRVEFDHDVQNEFSKKVISLAKKWQLQDKISDFPPKYSLVI